MHIILHIYIINYAPGADHAIPPRDVLQGAGSPQHPYFDPTMVYSFYWYVVSSSMLVSDIDLHFDPRGNSGSVVKGPFETSETYPLPAPTIN